MGRIAATTVAMLLMGSPAFGQCGNSTPFGNLLGSVAECDDTGALTGSVQAIDGTGFVARTTDDSFICLSQDQPGCGGTRPGVVGDGLIAFNEDWSHQIGCPTDGGGLAGGRNFFNVTDASGRRILFSVGRDPSFGAYFADNAWPSDSSGQFIANLTCEDPSTGVTVVSQTVEGNSATIQLICDDPQIRSDCDPDSRGIMLDRGSCRASDPAFLESLAPLNLYSVVADCAGRGLNYAITQGGWSLQPYNDLGEGIRETTVTVSPTQCVFLGCSFGTGPPPQYEYQMIYSAIPVGPSECHVEICDGLDNDCDTLIDEDLGETTCGVGACLRAVEHCVDGEIQTCEPGLPSTEICDGIDNDCNGVVDGVDGDGDGFTCALDCDDGDPSINPAAAELCNGIDDDCNGLVDDDGSGLDSDGDGVPNACDNCIDAFNPAQADTDEDGIGNSCDNCLADVNVDQTDTDFDGHGDACDNCPTEFNGSQADLDEDGVGDVCDNCLLDHNVGQGDVDGDFEGDVCDLDDGLIYTTMLTQTVVSWQPETGFATFNLYRGDVAVLEDGDGDGAADDYCAESIAEFLATTTIGETTIPGVGVIHFYVVTGNGPTGESGFGNASSGAPRMNLNGISCAP